MHPILRDGMQPTTHDLPSFVRHLNLASLYTCLGYDLLKTKAPGTFAANLKCIFELAETFSRPLRLVIELFEVQ